MNEEDINTWEKFEYKGTTWRVFYKLVETDYGPEMSIKLWSPITHSIYHNRECMGWKQLAREIVDNLN